MKTLILGAGPAGTSCAIKLLQAGVEVTLVDRARFPRDRPGETLHPAIEALLQQLGIWEDFDSTNIIRHSGIENRTVEASIFTPYHATQNWRGFQLPRKAFDHWLLQKAIDLGATFLEGVSPISLATNKSGEIISLNTSQTQLTADFYIDATGKRAWMAQQLKIPIRPYSPKRIAYYGYVAASCSEKYPHPIMSWDKEGWTWIAQIKSSVISWVRMDFVFKKKTPNWLPQQLRNHKRIGKTRTADVTWRMPRKVSDHNYFMIGDAAFVLDPASSHGILKAVMSGMMVAHLLTVHKPIPLKRVHLCYGGWIDKWFKRDVAVLRELYSERGYAIKRTAKP